MHKIAIMATAAVLCSAALADVFALKPGLNSIAAAITNKVLFGGGVLVTGAADGDIIKIIIK